ncbi:MAG: hypothetical protein F4Z66_03775 [Gammaproteobacteria bacterium]|nr:hypothetical protein [Gammaproteobacteria bacterium]
MNYGPETSSTLLAAMASGIGELVFLSKEWIEEIRRVLNSEARRRASQLADLGSFTVCEVAVNAPAYLRCGGRMAWNAVFENASVFVNEGELPAQQCDLKVVGDHSLMSNLARIQYDNRDPKIVSSAQTRLVKVGRWQIEGSIPSHPALAQALRFTHDEMAQRTMPRFVWMSPEWVMCTRHIVSTRALSDKYRHDLKDVDYTFAEEFVNPPRYAFPDGKPAGFWVRCDKGSITVGSGSLPVHLQPAMFQYKGDYVPVVPVGRTVEASMNEEDRSEQRDYSRTAFRHDTDKGEEPFFQQSFNGDHPEMPPALARVMAVLHDELSKRSSGELPKDYTDVREQWSSAPRFDRDENYDPTWLKYDEFDIYGRPLDQ